MTNNPSSLLECVFTLQEEVLKRNVAEFEVRYNFISACIELAGTPRIPDQSWQTLPVSQRVVLENLTILQYIVQFGLHDEAPAEIEGTAKQGKRFSDKFTYKTACNKLDIKDRRKRLKGDLSNFGDHVSPSKLKMSRFEIGDKNYGKVGVSINNPRTKIVIGELASLCLFFVKITDDFLRACKAKNREAFHQRQVELESRYENLTSAYLTLWPNS